MIVKLTNKENNFYQYMGKFFGSRLIQKETNDRIYDDADKVWYIYLKDDIALGFVSISKNTIKNVYAIKPEALKDLLTEVRKNISISPSIVTSLYFDVYQDCGFIIDDTTYKNFVIISDSQERMAEIS